MPQTRGKFSKFVVVPTAIGALTATLLISEHRRDDEGNYLYRPMSSVPDQPHVPDRENVPTEATTAVEWGGSGTNTTAALSVTTWNPPEVLVLPFDWDGYFVTRLQQSGLTVRVAPTGERLPSAENHET